MSSWSAFLIDFKLHCGDIAAIMNVHRYPFKTCNYNNRDWFFQPDTGPVLFPNLDVPLDQARCLTKHRKKSLRNIYIGCIQPLQLE